MISATSAVFLFYSVMLGFRVLISCDYTFNHKVEYEKGILKDECEEMLSSFFKDLRKLKSKK